MTAITKSMCINPPKVYELTIPKSHKIRSTTAIVVNMLFSPNRLRI